MSDPTGILLLDKPGGITSHDAVARARRALHTRKVGHAGTLDPMATGLLVLGVGAATRLLTYIVGLDKTYTATIRLGVATDTDDAEGRVTGRVDATELDPAAIDRAIAALTGAISQVPSTVSAIKVAGRRAYDLARAGETVELPAREVTVSRFEVLARRPVDGCCDLDVMVDCSSGTYIRALARDLGAALDVGGHLTALRRTRVGPFDVREAASVPDDERARRSDRLPDEPSAGGTPALPMRSPAEVAALVLGRLDVTAEEARDLRHGKRLSGAAARLGAARAAAIAPDGRLVGVVERRGPDLASAMNMPEGA